jgi:hypothetical protein
VPGAESRGRDDHRGMFGVTYHEVTVLNTQHSQLETRDPKLIGFSMLYVLKTLRTSISPATSASISSLLLYIANDARLVAVMPSRRINGCVQ